MENGRVGLLGRQGLEDRQGVPVPSRAQVGVPEGVPQVDVLRLDGHGPLADPDEPVVLLRFAVEPHEFVEGEPGEKPPRQFLLKELLELGHRLLDLAVILEGPGEAQNEGVHVGLHPDELPVNGDGLRVTLFLHVELCHALVLLGAGLSRHDFSPLEACHAVVAACTAHIPWTRK